MSCNSGGAEVYMNFFLSLQLIIGILTCMLLVINDELELSHKHIVMLNWHSYPALDLASPPPPPCMYTFVDI